MDLELRQLRAFIAVVDEGSFTAAGDTLGVSQASVSRAIGALERAVGTAVLHRTSRQLSLTAAGVRVLGHSRRMLEEAAAIQRITASTPGEVRIGHAWVALGPHTITVQQRWADNHPDSELRFVPTNTPTAGLAEGIVELAVVRQALDDERFDRVLVGVEGRYAAIPADDALARRRSVTLNDLAGRTVTVEVRTGMTSPSCGPRTPVRPRPGSSTGSTTGSPWSRAASRWASRRRRRHTSIHSRASSTGTSATRRRSPCHWSGGTTVRPVTGPS